MAERDFPKVEVAGSCPVSRSETWRSSNPNLAETVRLLRVDRALIQFICIRKTHRRKPPVDPSSPFNVAEEGGWAYCPGGEPDGHKWFKTGGITRAALAKFDWPDEEETEP